MARSRGGSTGLAAALVFFVCGFVIATLVAIIFYTKIEDHKNAETTAIEEMAKYVRPDETRRANDFVRDGNSAFANMELRIRELENDLDGPSGTRAEIARLEYLAQRRQDDYNTEVTNREEAQQELVEAEELGRETVREMQDRIGELIQEKDQLAGQIQSLRQDLAEMVAAGNTENEQQLAALNAQVREAEAEIALRDTTIGELRELLRVAQLGRYTPVVDDTAAPDGEVATVFENGRDMFISLGRRDGVVMGMTFEVFENDPVIRLSSDGEARGKATIEVYSLDGDSATCRIVRRDQGAVIEPGDPILNLAYNPNYQISMFAFGNFDIEYDGGPSDIGRIHAQILAAGGEIVELPRDADGAPILTPEVDYIVLGAEPEVPEEPDINVIDPLEIERYQAQLAAVETYFSILEEAKILRIPVLNQDRFMHLTGYYER